MRWTWMVLATMGLLAACTDGDKDTDAIDTENLSDEEIAEAIWSEISGYRSWGQGAGWEGVQYHNELSPHGGGDFPFLQTWINDQAAADWDGVVGGGSFSDGAILVKNTYDDAAGTTEGPETYVMKKLDGYGSDGWFWAVYDSAGTASAVGDVDMCSGCHSAGGDFSLIVTETPGTAP